MQQADERQKQIIFSSTLIFKICDIFFAIKMHVIFNLINLPDDKDIRRFYRFEPRCTPISNKFDVVPPIPSLRLAIYQPPGR